ncbi:hypothetical protein JIQ42_02533 [Leishmania sp. Namibia]|uniref:hypothetical protein n=1 Tax=Leishmania sp. Namibia TaxID=2802991 RepID=UPI001B53C4CF|nr:hypothetical protein JIQ42_02533 [Leishmania sp. Namibia]
MRRPLITMFSTDSLFQFISVIDCHSEEDAALHGNVMFPGVKGDASTQTSEELLRWLPPSVSAHLRRELLPSDRTRVAAWKQLTALRSGVGEGDAALKTNVVLTSRRAAKTVGQSEDEQLRVWPTTATSALAVLSVALRPLMQDSQPAISAAGSPLETSAVQQIEHVCIVLLRLVTSNLDLCRGTWAAQESALFPSLIIAGAVRQRLAASLKKWMLYFFLFFVDWLHRLQRSMAPMPDASRTSTKRQRAAAASLLQTAKPRVEAAGNDGPHKFQRVQAVLLPGPSSRCLADIALHPLHYYARGLQRAVENIPSGSARTPMCGSDGGDDELFVAAQSCTEYHNCHLCASSAALARPRRGAPLSSRGGACKRRAEASSGTKNISVAPSSLTESPPLYAAYLPQPRQRSPASRSLKRCELDPSVALAADDVPLLVLAERLRGRAVE